MSTVSSEAAAFGPFANDLNLVASLRDGDEAAFLSLVSSYHLQLVRFAQLYVRTREQAEDVVQETWLAVLTGLGRFEGRSSLKTWIFSILVNKARTRARQEGRTVSYSALGVAGELNTELAPEPAVDPGRFLAPGHQWAGGWASPPASWGSIPEERLLSQETLGCVQQAIDQLPPLQREVIALRDVEGWPPAEICQVLAISEPNQRVLLHRARSRVRRALEQYFAGEE
ncbi:MAG TPA: RNA polymerase sigma factor [Thermomicrobiaceae bacterium]|nr:RNA polymerase sigma factor [Thermomicrobiaceae bacterium]